ncbi:hypothetical protein ACJMK2_012434 [Sinanodonta woodiana]|uniref:Uncharacterized protein n=1 Tax=Sinanodonta woodiana TaxID=1069815 RepID=A0ABD3V888_SINWO
MPVQSSNDKSSSDFYPVKILETLHKLQQDGCLCDFTLSCADGCISVHKLLIMAASPFFQSYALNQSRPVRNIHFDDVLVMDLYSVVQYLYTGKLTLNDKNVSNVKKICQLLKMEDGVGLCDAYLSHREGSLTSEEETEEMSVDIPDITETSENVNLTNVREKTDKNKGKKTSSLLSQTAKSLVLNEQVDSEESLANEKPVTVSKKPNLRNSTRNSSSVADQARRNPFKGKRVASNKQKLIVSLNLTPNARSKGSPSKTRKKSKVESPEGTLSEKRSKGKGPSVPPVWRSSRKRKPNPRFQSDYEITAKLSKDEDDEDEDKDNADVENEEFDDDVRDPDYDVKKDEAKDNEGNNSDNDDDYDNAYLFDEEEEYLIENEAFDKSSQVNTPSSSAKSSPKKSTSLTKDSPAFPAKSMIIPCSFCDLSFPTMSKYNEHRRKEHIEYFQEKSKKWLNFNCPHCQRAFNSPYTMAMHMNTQHGVPFDEDRFTVFTCDVEDCNFQAVSMGVMTVHKNKKHSAPGWCEICKKKYANKYSLRMHQLVHEKNKFIQCEYCQETFITKKGHQLHIARHENKLPENCDVCHKQFPSKKTLAIHQNRYHKEKKINLADHGVKLYKCDICNYTGRKEAYMVHRKSHERKMKSEKGLMVFKCPDCDNTYVKSLDLMKHYKKTHGEKHGKTYTEMISDEEDAVEDEVTLDIICEATKEDNNLENEEGTLSIGAKDTTDTLSTDDTMNDETTGNEDASLPPSATD